jgi:uncharacterized membrane protein YoaK (UPF0700 family)
MNKPIEFWAVLLGMVIYVASRDAEREPVAKRVAKTLASALLTIGLSPTIAPWVRGSELLAAVAVMAFSMIVLDVATALLGDRDFIKSIIAKRLGGGEDGK